MFAAEYGYTIDEFLDLTMDQLICLRRRIERRKLEEEHLRLTLWAPFYGAKVKALDEVLPETQATGSEFDEATDKKLAAQALKKFEEMKAKHGERK